MHTLLLEIITTSVAAICNHSIEMADASGNDGQDTNPVTNAKNASYHPFTILAKMAW